MKAPEYKHYFQIVNGKFIWEDPDMFEYKRRILEGKRGYALIKGERKQRTPNQLAYYFGGIIRSECMASDVFKGLTDLQIHQILFSELRSTTRGIKLPDGKTKLVEVTEDFSAYDRRELALYINEVIALLQTEYDIHPKPPYKYEYNKFYINPETYKWYFLGGAPP